MGRRPKKQARKSVIELAPETTQWIDERIEDVVNLSRKQFGIPKFLSRRQFVEQIIIDVKIGNLVQRRELENTLSATLGTLLMVAEDLARSYAKQIAAKRKENAGVETRYERLQGGTPRMVFDYVSDGGYREELFPIDIDPDCARLLEQHIERSPGVKNVPAPDVKSMLEQTLE